MKKAVKKIFAISGAVALLAAIAMPSSAAAAGMVNRSEGLGDLFLLDKLFSSATNDNILNTDRTDLGDLILLNKLFPVQTAVAAPVAPTLAQQMAGRILLQVEDKGQAWYVNPTTRTRTFLNGPQQAFGVMSQAAIGISNDDFDSLSENIPGALRGRFVIKVQDDGELYYVSPVDDAVVYIPGANGASNLINAVGLGITNSNLSQIPIAD